MTKKIPAKTQRSVFRLFSTQWYPSLKLTRITSGRFNSFRLSSEDIVYEKLYRELKSLSIEC